MCDGVAVHVAFSPEERRKSSAWREARTALHAFRRFGARWAGSIVLLLTDNLGNVFTFMKGSSKSAEITAFLQEMYAISEQHGFVWACDWLPRECNQTADAISKCETPAAVRACCARLGLDLRA